MKLLVTGGRDFDDFDFLKENLDKLLKEHGPLECLIHGGAQGADFLAHKWAHLNNIEQKVYVADWKLYGRAAGIIRNKKMLEDGKPDLVAAFPTGGPGTKNMIEISQKAQIKVKIFTKET